MREFVRGFRANQTKTETRLWAELRNRKLCGLKFRRQYPVKNYVIDFYCAERKLGIELDGPIHENQKEKDKTRTELLESFGIKILRFKNIEIENDLIYVLDRIRKEATKKESSAPLSASGEGPGVR